MQLISLMTKLDLLDLYNKRKSEALDKFKQFVADTRKPLMLYCGLLEISDRLDTNEIKGLCSDNGGEYISN
jgi:hypothetical protein